MPKVSVIVPSYNSEKYIKKCVDSLINQTLKDIEIIIVNDGSSDNTKKILEEYKDSRVKVFNNHNHGIGYSRNYGLQKSKGNYISFIDSDDYVDDDYCLKMYNSAIKNKSDLVICNYYTLNETDNSNIKSNFELPSLFTFKECPNILNDVNLSPWNKLYSRKLLIDNKILFPEDLKYEDVIFVCKAYKYSSKISFVEDNLNYYLIHSNSETTTMNKRVFDVLKIYEKVYDLFSKDEFVKKELDMLLCHKLTDYSLLQKYQQDSSIRNEFINKAFELLKSKVKNYKSNEYFSKQPLLKRTIMKSRVLIIIYCLLLR